MRHTLALALMVLALLGASPVWAQQSQPLAMGREEPGRVISPILVVDMDRMFRESAFGQRVSSERDERVAALDAENLRVKEELEREEQSLTDLRDTTEAAAFRELADAFDQRVQKAETEQIAKQREILVDYRGEEDAFLQAAGPILERLLLQSGAVVILERPLVVASISQVDITDRAIALLDETIGSGVSPE